MAITHQLHEHQKPCTIEKSWDVTSVEKTHTKKHVNVFLFLKKIFYREILLPKVGQSIVLVWFAKLFPQLYIVLPVIREEVSDGPALCGFNINSKINIEITISTERYLPSLLLELGWGVACMRSIPQSNDGDTPRAGRTSSPTLMGGGQPGLWAHQRAFGSW